MKFHSFPFFQAKGSNYEIGYAIGKNFKQNIINTLQNSYKYQFILKSDKKDPEKVNQVINLVQEHFPLYIEEIRGISDGSSIDMRSILLMNFIHLFEEENCSTVIFRTSNKILIGHNEDHHKIMCDNSYYLNLNLKDGTNIFTHAYPGCLPGFSHGFNSHGIVITCNYLPDPVKVIGIPRTFTGRWILEAKSMEEAIDRALKFVPRSGGVSYNIASLKEKRVINLELTGIDHALTEITGPYFRTNHYISDKFGYIKIPSDEISTTRSRYNRGISLLPTITATTTDLLRLLWDDHVFINHRVEPHEIIHMTMNTTIFEIDQGILMKIYPRNRDKMLFDSFNF